MKSKGTNLVLLLHWILIISFVLSCSTKNSSEETQRNFKEIDGYIGEIEYNPEVDTLDFEPCDKNRYFIYSPHAGLGYEGEKPAIVQKIKSQYKKVNSDEKGYITIRFIVNCKGKAGMFRITEMDSDYRLKEFNEEVVSQLLEITMTLQEWKPGVSEGNAYDYYQYLTFKIEGGDIIDILP